MRRLAFFLFGLAALPAPAQASVDLHAHLWMKDGMGWLFNGGFNEPARAKHPRDGRSSQVDAEMLAESGMKLVVATLYANRWLVGGDSRVAIRKQIDRARKFVRDYPQWVIATEPAQARRALRENRGVLVLALEGASEILETEADFKEFVDEGGVRIVAPLHLTDDQFGGVALLSGYQALSSPFALARSWWLGAHDPESGVKTNTAGLSNDGRTLAQLLMDRGIWVDLAHASDKATRELRDAHEKRKLPLLVTHTSLRRYFRAERGISDEMLEAVGKSGGILGLMPSPLMLAGTPPDTGPECIGDLAKLRRQWRDAMAVVGRQAIALGSDTNGTIPHLGRSCRTGTPLDETGWVDFRAAEWTWKALGELADPTGTAERFLSAWERVRAGKSPR